MLVFDQKARLDGLDVLRASAAFSVFVGHFYILTQSTYELAHLPLVFRSFFSHGSIGVDLFYVLSGFFIGFAVMKPSFQPGSFFSEGFGELSQHISLVFSLLSF